MRVMVGELTIHGVSFLPSSYLRKQEGVKLYNNE